MRDKIPIELSCKEGMGTEMLNALARMYGFVPGEGNTKLQFVQLSINQDVKSKLRTFYAQEGAMQAVAKTDALEIS